ncbi:FliM/FliN family flagellar motor switch protein [Vannielia litorea]|uniref:FliM/FliN family flagellar motor switch protein n=1 Tax=Vannielia litorea TaxID=1217970 RepID=UPI001C96FA10|nr:FliM/FliN family flagellar motor switch protein [Vannielia litorea]MBY6046684.1 FliM/FliN family flagellar motor switch protein [Vannielia litorea]MBY6074098.1 FliM/FliN family flagellar motor switch protein [Vannielia litorea]
MTDTTRDLVLRRKLDAGAPDPALAVAGLPPVAKALGLAMARVSDKLMELVAAAESTGQSTRSLAELLDELPANGLYAVLEGPQEAQGVMVLDNALMGALIEQQTAGALAPGAPTARKPTRTDAALCADWIDAVLRALAETYAEAAQASWLSGFGFSCHLPDARPLGLMLEDEPFHVLDFALDLGEGARKGSGKLILPALGRAPEGRPAASGEPGAEPHPDDRAAWERRLEGQVMDAEVTLLAVLHRFRRSIGEVQEFAEGDVIALPEGVINALRLETGDGTAVAAGRLGQTAGARAVRLRDADDLSEPEDEMGAAMAALDDTEDDLPSLPAMPEAEELPDLPDLPGAEDTEERVDPLAGLEDLPDIPELDGDFGGLGEEDLPELPELGEGGLPELPDLPDLEGLTGT